MDTTGRKADLLSLTRLKGERIHMPVVFQLTLTEIGTRYALVAGCRWVDAIAHDVPYNAQLDILDEHGIGEHRLKPSKITKNHG